MWVSTRSWRRSASSWPSAHRMPGAGGTMSRPICSSRATGVPCIGPAPPNGTSVHWRGSWPRSTETTRMPRTMLACATRKHTHRSRNGIDAERFGDVGFDRVCGLQRDRAADCRRAASRFRACPARGWRRRSSAGCRHDRSRPAPARPPRSSARRASAPPSSIQAIEPPPAPMALMSIVGSRIGI